jgi:hypothetical protein
VSALAELLDEGERLAVGAYLPEAEWRHVEKGRIYLADGGMIASVREQIPEGIDPDGDDPKAWEIGDEAVEEAGRRAELVAFLVNHGPTLLTVAKAAVEMRAAESARPGGQHPPYGHGPVAVHTYRCPATKIGKKSGPCDCGGDALQTRIDASRVAFDAALDAARGGAS